MENPIVLEGCHGWGSPGRAAEPGESLPDPGFKWHQAGEWLGCGAATTVSPDDPGELWSPAGPLEGPTLRRGCADALKQLRPGGTIGSHLRKQHPQSAAEAETDSKAHSKVPPPKTQEAFTEWVPLPGAHP